MDVIKPKLHHVTFKTSRLDEMVAWYGILIGVKPNFKDKYHGWTTSDDANHRVAFLSVAGLEDDTRKEYHNCAHHSAKDAAPYLLPHLSPGRPACSKGRCPHS